MPLTKMTGVIVREWLSHNDNDPAQNSSQNLRPRIVGNDWVLRQWLHTAEPKVATLMKPITWR
jgi:hypothetical protein